VIYDMFVVWLVVGFFSSSIFLSNYYVNFYFDANLFAFKKKV